jgi:engulfment/cell motility protein 1
MATNELLGTVGTGNVGGGGGMTNTGGAVGGHSSAKRWRYYKLSPSKKALQFGDFSDRIAPIIKDYDKLPNKIDLSGVVEIRTVRKPSNVGSMSLFPMPPTSPSTLPTNTTTAATAATTTANTTTMNNTMATTYDTSSGASLAFALYNDSYTPLAEFICATSEQASEWKDGFSMLMDKGITSKETAEYLHSLTEIGVKVKLLQIAGDRVEVPHGSLEVPPIPYGSGARFYYDV